MALKRTPDPARPSKRKKETEKEPRPPCEDGREVYMDPDDQAVRAARAHGCICGVWIPSRVKKKLDVWNQLPDAYSTRRPRPKSHKKKKEGEDPAGGEHRMLYFAEFFATAPIPADVQSVGLPGDVWVAPTTVQVYDGTCWISWGSDAAPNGLFEHPKIPCFLAWKVEDHRLGYAGRADTVADWAAAWDRDCTLAAFARMKMGFESRIHPDAVANAFARARELVSTTDSVTGLPVAVPYRSLSQEALAALLFPLHDPSLPSFAGHSPPTDNASLPVMPYTPMPGQSPQPHAGPSVLTANSPAPPLSGPTPLPHPLLAEPASARTDSAVTAPTAPVHSGPPQAGTPAPGPAPSFGESVSATMRPPAQPHAGPSAATNAAVTAPTGPAPSSAATNAAVTAPTGPAPSSAATNAAVTAPTRPAPSSAVFVPLGMSSPASPPQPLHSRASSEQSALSELPPHFDEDEDLDNLFSGLDLRDLPPGFTVEMVKDLPDATFLHFTTGRREILPPFMQDPEEPDGCMARAIGQGQDGYLPLPESAESGDEVYLRSSDPPFAKLRLEQFKGSSDIAIAAAVVEHLQVGQVVVMHGCDYPDLPWDLRTFAHLSGGLRRNGEYSLEGEIEWQSAQMRILSRNRDNDDDDDDDDVGFTMVGTWLDFTRVASPRLLDEVLEGADTSFEAPVNLLDLATSMDTTGSAPFLRELRDDVKAEDMLSRRLRHAETYHVNKTKSKGWVLVSGAGYLSYSHVDGSGECTFFMLTHGRKWWAVLKMKRGCDDPAKVQDAKQQMQKVFKHYLKIAKASNDYNVAPHVIPDLATIHFVLLEPGMILIQPPGVFHIVYTPVPSIGVGGHFFTEETLHLTLQCRLVIQRSSGQGTNAYHADASRSLARMLLAVVERGDREMNRRGLIFLARMLKQRKTHFSLVDFYKEDTGDDDLTFDDTEFEIGLACDLADEILAHNSLDWEGLKLDDSGAYPYFPEDDVLPWYERGAATVAIPGDLKDTMIDAIETYADKRKKDLTEKMAERQAKDKGEGQAKDKGKGQAKDKGKGQAKDKGKGQAKDKGKGQAKDKGKGRGTRKKT